MKGDRSQTGAREEKSLSDRASVKREKKKKKNEGKRRSDSDHKRAKKMNFLLSVN